MVDNRVLLSVNNQVPTAGVYELLLGDEVVDAVAFNYDRREADLTYLEAADLDALGDIANVEVIDADNQASFLGDIRAANEGTPLWRYFIWAALAFFLVEVLLLRFWRA